MHQNYLQLGLLTMLLPKKKILGVDLMKFKSITTKITLSFAFLMFAICVGLGVSAYLSSSNALKTSIDENLLQIAEADANIIGEKINTQFNALQALAESPWIKSNELTMYEKADLLRDEVKRNGHVNMLITNTNGDVVDTDKVTMNIKERDYFKKAVAGEPNVSDPLIDMLNKSVVIMLAVPIKENGNVTGVLVAIQDGNSLSEYTHEMEVNQQEVFMINPDGITIADSDNNRVLEMYSIFEQYESDPELES